jgi:hypothetical protein
MWHVFYAEKDVDVNTTFSKSHSDRGIPLFLFQGNDFDFVGIFASGGLCLPQKIRGYIPMLPVIGDDGHCLPIIPGQHPENGRTTPGLKGHTVADLELQHSSMRTHLVEKTKPLHDPMVEVDQFRLGQFVNVDFHVTASQFKSSFMIILSGSS